MAWGDYDNDGDLDLYLGKDSGVPGIGTISMLYRNNGDGTFIDVAASSGTSDSGSGHGVAWADFDNDGLLDFHVVNAAGPNRLYHNNGDGTFTDVAASTGIDDSSAGQGAAWGDYDHDGDLDLYLANFGGGNRLFRNDTVGNHWLHVDVVGTTSNRSSIGARLRCVTGGVRQIREIDAGSGYFAHNSLTVEFGLGSAGIVDSLEIRWPSGTVRTLLDVAVDQRITISETQTTSVPRIPTDPTRYALHANVPNPFNPFTSIAFDLAAAGEVILSVYDVRGRLVRTLVDGDRYESGRHRVTWDGRDEHAREVPSGIYFYRIRVDDFSATNRMVLMK